MITTAIALLVALQAPAQTQDAAQAKSPVALLSKMLARYHDAKSVAGTIKMTQTVKDVTLVTDTTVQFDRPSKLFLKQTRGGAEPRQWLITSDGKYFSYDRPNDTSFGRSRYVELVTQHDVSQKIDDIYAAGQKSLGDLNPMLDAVMGESVRLKLVTGQWENLVYRGRVKVRGKEVDAISGQYRDNPASPISGTVELYLTDDGDFFRYVLQQNMSFPQVSQETFHVVTIWDSDLKLDKPTDPALYKVATQ